jgi:hypothetical protein
MSTSANTPRLTVVCCLNTGRWVTEIFATFIERQALRERLAGMNAHAHWRRRSAPRCDRSVVFDVAGAAVFARLSTAMLYRVSPGDPMTYVEASAGLLIVALTAAWVPSWRAGRVDPTVALRG